MLSEPLRRSKISKVPSRIFESRSFSKSSSVSNFINLTISLSSSLVGSFPEVSDLNFLPHSGKPTQAFIQELITISTTMLLPKRIASTSCRKILEKYIERRTQTANTHHLLHYQYQCRICYMLYTYICRHCHLVHIRSMFLCITIYVCHTTNLQMGVAAANWLRA